MFKIQMSELLSHSVGAGFHTGTIRLICAYGNAQRQVGAMLLCMFPLFLLPIAMQGNPTQTIDTTWLESRLADEAPRLIWQTGDENRIRERIAHDPAARANYDDIIEQADGILPLPVLTRELEGRRLLGVSRSALKRATHLAFAWRMTQEKQYLERLDALLLAVSAFNDWNPSHFLDVAEMSLAVAIALDWCGEDLPPQTQQLARTALIEKALRTAEEPENQSPFLGDHNWTQVCNAGIVAAALVVAEQEPESAINALRRMTRGIPNVLKTYGPDGVYVEGPMYWSYGTEFHVMLISMLESALGTDMDLAQAPGFMESADFLHLMTAPSGLYYNFSDCSDSAAFTDGLLWFAMKTGAPRHAQADALLSNHQPGIDPASTVGRIRPISFLWYLRYQPGDAAPLPLNWVGYGKNPIGVFRSSFDDPHAIYLAFKGGKAANPHGNADAGSFILELNGVRWSIDTGVQAYHPLEEYFTPRGGNLWSSAPDSVRWTLLTKNNFGHSTLTIDDTLHTIEGKAEITAFDPESRTATLDIAAPLGEKVRSATRRFSVPDDNTVIIHDSLSLTSSTSTVRWQMMTQAEVSTFPGGALLHQNGKTLRLEIISPENMQVSVSSLNPPPHPMDKSIPALKRIDIQVPAHLANGEDSIEITVRLSSVKK